MQTKNPNNFLIVLLVITLTFSPWICNQNTASAKQVPANEEPRYITVRGDAEVRIVPDEVLITLGVESRDANLYTAKKENDKILQRARKIIESYSVPARHIQLEYIYIDNRDYYYENNDYIVRRTLTVTLQDLSKFEDLLTSVLNAGITNVHGIQFRTTELRKYKDQARDLAIKAAKEKAIDLADALDQTIGVPTNIIEEQVYWNSWYSSWWGSYWGGSTAQNVIQEIGGANWVSEGGAIPGQISITARVSVTFTMHE